LKNVVAHGSSGSPCKVVARDSVVIVKKEGHGLKSLKQAVKPNMERSCGPMSYEDTIPFIKKMNVRKATKTLLQIAIAGDHREIGKTKICTPAVFKGKVFR
jgi:hypothetical protein